MPYKPGIKTSELAVTVLVIVGQLVAALTSNLKPEWAAFGTAISAAAYALSRGITKAGTPTVIAPAVPVTTTPAPPK